MSRTRARALELAVLRAARGWLSVRGMEHWMTARHLADAALTEAVKALDEAFPIDLDGEPVSNGTSTSNRAAARALPLQHSIRYKILAELLFVHERYPSLRGKTADELETTLRSSHATVTAAVAYLKGQGWVEDSGYERPTRSKRDAIVLTLSPAGLAAMNEGALT